MILVESHINQIQGSDYNNKPVKTIFLIIACGCTIALFSCRPMHRGHGDWEVVMLYVSFSFDFSLQAEKWMKVSVQTEYSSQNAHVKMPVSLTTNGGYWNCGNTMFKNGLRCNGYYMHLSNFDFQHKVHLILPTYLYSCSR